MKDKAMIHFRRLRDNKIVYSFEVPAVMSSRDLDRVCLDALMNMRNDLFLDDSEVQVREVEK